LEVEGKSFALCGRNSELTSQSMNVLGYIGRVSHIETEKLMDLLGPRSDQRVTVPM